MPLFEGAAEAHHYKQVRELVARVPTEVLSLAPSAIRRRYEADPLSLTRD